MYRILESEAIEIGGTVSTVGAVFTWVAEFLTPFNINDYLQVILGVLSILFIWSRISLNIYKKRGQKIRNQLDQNELDKQNDESKK